MSFRSPVIIGHRGASGYRPEHTLGSYRLAIALGADYVEPDLVVTRDGVLVARHENELSGTTDVAEHPEFAHRRATKTIDGRSVTGWFTEDLTLAELRTLRVRERMPQLRPHNRRYDRRETVPTLQDVIDLVRRESRRFGRQIGIYPETKTPTYFDSIGLPPHEPLVRTLNVNGLNHPDAKVFVQSFETTNLRMLREVLRVPLVQLIGASGGPYDLAAAGRPRSYGDLVSPSGLAEIAAYADGIGPSKGRIIARDADGMLLPPTSLVDHAHDAGLLVHPYTFRDENAFLPADLRLGTDPGARGKAAEEYALFLAAGVDGVFSDHPDTAVTARGDFLTAAPTRGRCSAALAERPTPSQSVLQLRGR
jgi:glycerophosphoryl diester phosphodiesterase